MKKLILIIIMGILCAMPMQAEGKQGTAKEKTERVTDQATDPNPIVGKDKKGRAIHRGGKGGLYYWHVPKSGKNAGRQVKRYLSKAEKEEFAKQAKN